ncbi:MAG: hypothetical protein JRI85_10905 [Deltaproteobacteria bacterium]|nr:hypothetical protein [Deltaproteobacteria bacterium]
MTDSSRAMICLDCDRIVDVETEACPYCCSRAVWPLANWLETIDITEDGGLEDEARYELKTEAICSENP